MTRSLLFASAAVSAIVLALTAFAQAPPAGGPTPQAMPGGPTSGEPNPGAAEGTPWPVIFVTGIDVVRTPFNGRDIVIAHGLVTSSAWRSPYLLPITAGKPADGVLDLLLQAQAPQKPGPLGEFMEVDAILPLGRDHPYTGVRVRSARNALFLKTLPGHAEVKKLKNDCAQCIGKRFVAKGESPPAGVPAGEIVREEDLLWEVRVIKPRDGIHSYTINPNRLTVVLSEDGRVLDAAWD
jgi:hypothetical protein